MDLISRSKKEIKRLIKFFSKIIFRNYFIPYKGFSKVDLLIFDNIYPHPVSGFRFEEFTVLLNKFKKSKIVMCAASYRVINTPISEHKKHIDDLVISNKSLTNKLKLKKGFLNINAKLFYCVFLNNIISNLEWIEKFKIPFIFTLYPGGGFQINNEKVDLQLKKVFDSPMFKKVIVTQQITLDYLINKNLCKIENIEFIFGGVVPQKSINRNFNDKKSYLINKETFDICFCAAKYSIKGKDKGYDVFIDFAHKIAAKFDFIRFHIIGGFGENEIDINSICNKIHFYGYQNFDNLRTIYKNMDVLISPNKPFILHKGAFDGFPLGTVVEAALSGVVVLVSDELKQNKFFVHNEEIIIIKNNSNSIEKEILNLITNPSKLYSISKKGKNKFIEVYSNKIQMNPRVLLLQNEIEKI